MNNRFKSTVLAVAILAAAILAAEGSASSRTEAPAGPTSAAADLAAPAVPGVQTPSGSASYTKEQEYLFDLIQSRRTVRAFKDTPVPEEHLLMILDMARRAPTSGNQQPWKFLVVRDRKKLEALKKDAAAWYLAAAEARGGVSEEDLRTLRERMAATMDRVLSAPVYVACLVDNQSAYPPDNRHDGPMAVALLMIAARALGYGTGYYTTFFPEDKMRGFLGIPDRYSLLCFTPIGVPVEWPKAPPKKPLSDFVVFEAFDKR